MLVIQDASTLGSEGNARTDQRPPSAGTGALSKGAAHPASDALYQ